MKSKQYIIEGLKLSFQVIILMASLLIVSCQTKQSTVESEVEALTIDSSDSITKVEIKYARGFNVSYHDGYKLLTINNPFDKSAEPTRYLLVNKGNPRPAGFEKSIFVETPVDRMVALSTTHVGLLEFLEADSVIVGLENLNYVYSEQVYNAYSRGEMIEVGRNMVPDNEKIIALQPDLVMGEGGPGSSQYHTLESAGLPVLINSDWVEATPLGKAEWVKLMAVLLNKEEFVNKKFAQIEEEYHRLKGLANSVAEKPKILTGINLKDVWYMPKGQNYMAAFLKDAGADYPLANEKGQGSSALSFESVYPMALEAEYWVNLGGMNLNTKKDIVGQDVRYADFKAFKESRIFDYTNRINSRGANDFWESAVVRPDLVLSDLIKIFHPSLLPDYQLYYYKQLK